MGDQQQLERGSGRPAGHAPALQIDNSHRLHSREPLVRGKEEPGGKPPAGGTPQVPSFKFSLCKLGPAAARAAVEELRIALVKLPVRQQIARAIHQSARKEHNTAKVPCRVSSFNHAE